MRRRSNDGLRGEPFPQSRTYDLTILEVRRVLYDDIARRQKIVPGRLLGTRFAWMTISRRGADICRNALGYWYQKKY
jgi:hypothetical protein